jgi:AbrB family looped-hinge helix DNA binding protein
MKTKLSTKGQVVLPVAIRRKLGLQPGETLDASVDGESVKLTPARKRTRRARIINDPITGLPVLTLGNGAPVLTSKQVRETLDEFP